jgi:hypothetical protein
MGGDPVAFAVGQRYRDDESGYLWDVVAVESSGAAWCRHPNAKRPGATLTNAGWASVWTLIKSPEEASS